MNLLELIVLRIGPIFQYGGFLLSLDDEGTFIFSNFTSHFPLKTSGIFAGF